MLSSKFFNYTYFTELGIKNILRNRYTYLTRYECTKLTNVINITEKNTSSINIF